MLRRAKVGAIVPDKYQKAVIDSKAKDIVVLAGAGSGKTFTLVQKINKLVDYMDVDPDSILVLTFTRVASENMRAKYVESISSKYDRTPDFCTFHAFCYKVMSEYPEVLKALGYKSLPSIIDEGQRNRYVLKAKYVTSCSLSSSQLANPDSLTGADKLSYEHFEKYLAKLLSRDNVIDYDTLSQSVCNLFSSNDPSVEAVRERYKYLFVDEFQDTDKYQYDFVKSMTGCSRVLCGDALQNIYQFRGCSNEPLKELVNSKSWLTCILPVNYRSTSQICNYVNHVSESFASAYYQVLLISDRSGQSVRKWTSRLATDKYDDLAKYVKWASKYGNVAVLCRTNSAVFEAKSELTNRGVAVSSKFDKEYLTSVATCLAYPEKSVESIVARMSDEDYCQLQKESLTASDKELSDVGYYRSFPSVNQFVSDVQSASSALYLNSPKDAAFVLCNSFGIDPPKFPVESKEEVVSHILNRVESKPDEQVYVGTIHSVKGLEFNSVAVVGVNSKSFKIDNEERENILYTALTRAMNNLIVFDES